MKCPNCGGQNFDYKRVCEYCNATLARPSLTSDQQALCDQFLSMSLGVEDLSTIGFALGVDEFEPDAEQDEGEQVEMLVRMLASQGRVREVTRSLRDLRFPQSYAPLPGPYLDNLWLTYVFACQNITSMSQFQEMCDQAGIGDAHSMPGKALPHKIREALRIAHRYDKLTYVHEWLQTLKPKEGLKRPRRRRRRQ